MEVSADNATLTLAVEKFYRYQFQDSPSDFSIKLFDLILKSDDENMIRLAASYPEEVGAVMLWRQAPSETDFFKAFGIDIEGKERARIHADG